MSTLVTMPAAATTPRTATTLHALLPALAGFYADHPAEPPLTESPLTEPPLILASASPRRKVLLEQLGFRFGVDFVVQPSAFDEDSIATTHAPSDYVRMLALAKAQQVAEQALQAMQTVSEQPHATPQTAPRAAPRTAPRTAPRLVIGADTTVVLDGMILNKPATPADAVAMLRSLSGRAHQVFTGFALVLVPPPQEPSRAAPSQSSLPRQSSLSSLPSLSDVCATTVQFRALDDAEIHAYVASGSPFDKAGGYGIQDDLGAVFVERIDGCYYNVVGLPLQALYLRLRDCMAQFAAQQ
jgi:septum formation protein